MHSELPLPMRGGGGARGPPVRRRPPGPGRAATRGHGQARRQALHQQVWALHHQGWTAPAIAQQVGLGLRTVDAISDAPPLQGTNS